MNYFYWKEKNRIKPRVNTSQMVKLFNLTTNQNVERFSYVFSATGQCRSNHLITKRLCMDYNNFLAEINLLKSLVRFLGLVHVWGDASWWWRSRISNNFRKVNKNVKNNFLINLNLICHIYQYSPQFKSSKTYKRCHYRNIWFNIHSDISPIDIMKEKTKR